ncbi:Glucans biosynthesis protein D 2 [Frankliniella fusca]|uniref:Glucans biosynthesis protein D 2 n=1 Tax=Frankliniella fusca TaxID=407009 RepID=A0AAE1LI97_9NEOP|nr:Glucans biosynthesis protein D 2 [Frankliniella fusca]
MGIDSLLFIKKKIDRLGPCCNSSPYYYRLSRGYSCDKRVAVDVGIDVVRLRARLQG